LDLKMHTGKVHAQNALDEISRVESRTEQAAIYGASSAHLLMWGVVVATAYLVNQFWPAGAELTWPFAWATGSASSVLVSLRWKQGASEKYRMARRVFWAPVILLLFGALFLWLLPPSSSRQLNAFWPLMFMMGYVVAGLWLGRFFILCGILVSALTVIGYLYSGPWLPLWMAFANGGALIAGGLYLRKVGLRL
jgi:hypothetical protein